MAEVKKPGWIRVLGWLSAAGLVYLAVMALEAQAIAKSSPNSAPLIAGLFVLFACCFVIWVVSTIIWKFRVSRAEAKAARVEPYWRPAGSPLMSAARTPASPERRAPSPPESQPAASVQTGSTFQLNGGVQTASTYTLGTVAEAPPITTAQLGREATSSPIPAEQQLLEPLERKVYTYEAPGLPLCPECRERPAIFYCAHHSKFLCLQCVVVHDDPGICQYVPAFRAKHGDSRDRMA